METLGINSSLWFTGSSWIVSVRERGSQIGMSRRLRQINCLTTSKKRKKRKEEEHDTNVTRKHELEIQKDHTLPRPIHSLTNRLYFLNSPQRLHDLGIQCSNTRSYEGHFLFNSPHKLRQENERVIINMKSISKRCRKIYSFKIFHPFHRNYVSN